MTMTEKSFIVMKGTQFLFLFLITGCFSFILGSSDYHHINLLKTYQDAKSYCRQIYVDLATVRNSTDTNILVNSVSSTTRRAWIGLELGNIWKWHWVWSDEQVDFLNWRAGEPQNKSEDGCAAMDPSGQWFESDCNTKRSFVCRGYGDAASYILVADTSSWRDAQSHCRGLSSDLVSIHSAEENEEVRSVSVSRYVWIGLFRDAWRWSDGSNSSFRYWRRHQPNYEGQECVAAVFRSEGQWNDLKCSIKLRFVCQGARKPVPTTSQTSTQQTLTTTLPTYMTTLLNSSFNFTVAASTQPSYTGGFTKDVTTVTSADPLFYLTSTEPHNTATEMTTTPQYTTITMPVTIGGASTSVVETSEQDTSQSTSQPYTNPQTSGNLILIQENVTWIEALSYCREHHTDLAFISNRATQDEVAEMARNATSSYVWLSLRYTCKFNFWFWANSATSCYQNWASGQGPGVKYGCGVTGAIETTGGQQWVGLPETERLNFICHVCS
ncbi:uncharacterized protein ACBR49_005531 [Aulostomus maculatus]